jgi:hypothetical protein
MPLVSAGISSINATWDNTPSLVVPATGGTPVRTRFVNVQGTPKLRVLVERVSNSASPATAFEVRLYRRTGPEVTDIQSTNYVITVPAAAAGTIEELAAYDVAAGDICALFTPTAGLGTSTVRVTFTATA